MSDFRGGTSSEVLTAPGYRSSVGGTPGAPGYSWTVDPTSGLYLNGGRVGLSVGGQSVLELGPGETPLVSSWRNVILNGDFRFRQDRDFTAVQSFIAPAYAFDGLLIGRPPGGAFSCQGVNDLSNPEFTRYARFTVTATAGAPLGADTAACVWPIEGFDMNAIRSHPSGFITASLWLRASRAGTYTLAHRSSNRGHSILTPIVIATPNVWRRYSVTWPTVPLGLGATFSTDNSFGGDLVLCLASGPSNVSSTLNTWQAGNFFAAPTQSNFQANLGDTLDVTGVQLEGGARATAFEHLPVQVALARCQRYYEKSYLVETPPNTPTGQGVTLYRQASTGFVSTYYYRVSKRLNPALTIISETGGSSVMRDYSAAVDRAAAVESSSSVGASVSCTPAPVGNLLGYHFVADARL